MSVALKPFPFGFSRYEIQGKVLRLVLFAELISQGSPAAEKVPCFSGYTQAVWPSDQTCIGQFPGFKRCSPKNNMPLANDLNLDMGVLQQRKSLIGAD
jgi:hypothetical protein